jgi:hypothetical protein
VVVDLYPHVEARILPNGCPGRRSGVE